MKLSLRKASGSVKSNIGHLEGCSGLAGILKSIMMLEKGIIPPSALFEKISPKINARIYNVEVRRWACCVIYSLVNHTQGTHDMHTMAQRWVASRLSQLLRFRRFQRTCHTGRCIPRSRVHEPTKLPQHIGSFNFTEATNERQYSKWIHE